MNIWRRNDLETIAPSRHCRRAHERVCRHRCERVGGIARERGHHTAEAIFERAKLKYPYINLATVYRTLTWLRDQGLISETDLGGGHTEYEALGSHRHHHLVCLACGGRMEFADELVAPLAAALHERYGFEARLDHLAVFGLCRGCREHVGDSRQ